jgi:hypothetical protein
MAAQNSSPWIVHQPDRKSLQLACLPSFSTSVSSHSGIGIPPLSQPHECVT